MNSIKRALIIVIVAWLSQACGDTGSRHEVIAKLRGIGAVASPLVSLPSVTGEVAKTVDVTVTVAMPLGDVAEITPFTDISNGFSLTLPEDAIAIQPASVAYTAYNGFQMLTFVATLPVPYDQQLIPFGGKIQVRYGFRITSNGEEEKLVGSFLVFPEGSPELAWINPEIVVESPSPDGELASGNKVDLSATFVDANGEGLKMGWFASGGEIQNRRARRTVWETPNPGPHTLILTAYGRKSRGFAMQIINVTTK